MKKLLMICVVIGLILVVSSPLAAIPVQTFTGEWAISDNENGTSFSIDGDGTFDINLAWFGYSVNSIFAWDAIVRQASAGSAGIVSSEDENGCIVSKRFASDELIGPASGNLNGYTKAGYWMEWGGPPIEGGEFLDETRGYVGFSFHIGPDTHWGWAEISIDLSGDPGEGWLILYGYGYETEPDTPIAAGAPEPAMIALLGLGSLVLLRRKRK
ncbi:MAG: hypothetical protein DRP62_04460 [Planctomycetota bacterium]|nr:MAG: hypothetical protein DRP62_04460 [Planctomycetota bacterium]